MRKLLVLLFAVVPCSAFVFQQAPPDSIPTQIDELENARSAKPKCADVQFPGEVLRDQRFEHDLPGRLEFRLIPYPEGWSIFIGRPGDRPDDYASIATPPYHGVNPVIIEAWHFRNADNFGPNQGDVNAPTSIRDFSFVVNEVQYKKFADALDIWSGHKPSATEKQRDDATNFLLSAPRQSGTMTIDDMKLGGLEKGKRPWFESMKFHVDICLAVPAGLAVDTNKAVEPAPLKNP